MRNQGQIIVGLLIIAAGLAFLIGNLLDTNVWVFCWPIGLILLGLWLLFRPRMVRGGTRGRGRGRLLGDIRRDGAWRVADREYWIGIGDIRLDMRAAEIPQGETHLRVMAFIGAVRLAVPAGVGVSVSATGFISDVTVMGRKRESFFVPAEVDSADYATAERTIRLETLGFINEVKVRQVEEPALDK
jgi:predicted membrane protein